MAAPDRNGGGFAAGIAIAAFILLPALWLILNAIHPIPVHH